MTGSFMPLLKMESKNGDLTHTTVSHPHRRSGVTALFMWEITEIKYTLLTGTESKSVNILLINSSKIIPSLMRAICGLPILNGETQLSICMNTAATVPSDTHAEWSCTS